MEKEYTVNSERYGHKHKFVQIEGDKYDFVPEKSWMPIYVTLNDDNKGVSFIDTEGGPCIGVGWSNDKIEVVDIVGNYFILKEKATE
jgi:hypothetical protein